MSAVAIVVVRLSARWGDERPTVRARLGHHQGRVTTVDDAVRGVFDSVGTAMEAAVDVQRAESVGGDHRAGIGVDLGEDDAGDSHVFQAASDTASRLATLAAPGQIVVTSAVRTLLARRGGFVIREHFPDPDRSVGHPLDDEPLYLVDWTPAAPTSAVRVVVADDAPLIRSGIVQLLTSSGFDVLAEAADAEALLAAVGREPPDLVITDIRMPPGHSDEGLRAAARIRAAHPGVAVLVLSQHIEARAAADLLDGRPAGIGYLLKERVSDLDEFVDACTSVAEGGSVIDTMVAERLIRRRANDDVVARLSERERDVLEAMARGLSNQAIADELFLGKKTIETHVGSIFQKLDLDESAEGNRRVQAVLQFLNANRAD